MKPRVRASLAAVAVLAASVATVGHLASAGTSTTDSAPAETARKDPRLADVSVPGPASDPATPVPGGDAGDIVVDETHGLVFITRPEVGKVAVTDLDGRLLDTLEGFSYPTHLAISDDDGTVFVTEFHGNRIGVVDTAGLTSSHIPTPQNQCPVSVGYTGGRPWYVYQDCDGSYLDGGIGVIDPAGGTASSVLVTRPGAMFALPDRPDRTVLLDDWGQIAVYDLSGDTPATVATLDPAATGRELCRDAAFLDSGDKVVTACGYTAEHEVFNTADLSTVGAIPSGENPNAVAVSGDGGFVAAGTVNADDIYVRDTTGGVPGTAVRGINFDGGLDTHSLAFSRTGRLYAFEGTSVDTGTLHVYDEATKTPTTITLDLPRTVDYNTQVRGSGKLSPAPGETLSVKISRMDRNGTQVIGSVFVDAEGTFAFTDTPDATGHQVYVAEYAGDASRASGGAKAGTVMRPKPYDINADGFADVVVGAPGEDIGSVRDAGNFAVLYGRSSGLNTGDSIGIHQDKPGVPGKVERGDGLGYSNAMGDFNGDGFVDVAVSAGTENIGAATDGGLVEVFYGSANGLTTDNVTAIGVDDTVLGSNAEYVYLGDALAAGDFDNDGHDDLAIGAPGASHVFVAPGSFDGLSPSNLRTFTKDTPGVPGEFDSGEGFGITLATGDANGDGRDELAVGATYDAADRGFYTGSVTVLYAGSGGLTGDGAQRWSKDSTGVPGVPGWYDYDANDVPDQFGFQLVLDDLDGDADADLAVGAPGSPVTRDGIRKPDAGTVTVLYSDGSAIGTAGAVQVDQQTTGMPGKAGRYDYLGFTLASGDTDGDGDSELAAYSPGDTFVAVVPGASGGLAFGSARGWTQNSGGIPGKSEPGDLWGDSLRFADIRGDGLSSMIVGADGENHDKGAFTVVYSTSSGLTGSGATYFSQNTSGVPGAPEDGDRFGTFY